MFSWETFTAKLVWHAECSSLRTECWYWVVFVWQFYWILSPWYPDPQWKYTTQKLAVCLAACSAISLHLSLHLCGSSCSSRPPAAISIWRPLRKKIQTADREKQVQVACLGKWSQSDHTSFSSGSRPTKISQSQSWVQDKSVFITWLLMH